MSAPRPRTREALVDLIEARLPDNVSGEISPATLREVLAAIVESAVAPATGRDDLADRREARDAEALSGR